MRLADWVVMVVAVAVLGWAIILDTVGEPLHEDLTVRPPRSAYEERIAVLEREAIDTAYRQQISALYLTWLKDPSGQPHRALMGERRARAAYIDIMKGMEERERWIKQQP